MGSKICFISPCPESTKLYREALIRLSEPPLIVEGALAAAERVARAAEEKGYDIFVTQEHNARYLLERLNTTIVAIPITPIVIAQALNRARTEYGEPVALFQFRYHYINLSPLKEVLKCQISEFVFHDERDALSRLHQALQEDYRAVVGGAVIMPIAREIGIPCVQLLPKAEDILTAFHQAQQITLARQIEQRETMKFRYIVQYSFTGIIVADKNNKITVYNPAAERIFEIPISQALGRSFEQVIPQSQRLTLSGKEDPQLGELKTIGHKQLMVNRIPIIEEGKVIGTIFTFQEVSKIQSMEEKIRLASHAKGLSAKMTFQDIIGVGKIMKETIIRARRFAASEETIVIMGESGTGKELFAQSIHNASSRHSQPFVAVNCSAIPPTLLESELFGYAEGAFTGARRGGKQGVFELAHRGTIFLDEVSGLSLEAQGHLLRVIQEKEVMRVGDGKVTPVDVRVVVATNRPLEQAVQRGSFRLDLYYRLNVLQLRLPSLREHPEDILLMTDAFVAQSCSNQWLAGKIKKALLKHKSTLIRYSWPGNVRELKNIMKRIVALVETMKGDSVEAEVKDLLYETFANPLGFIPVLTDKVLPGKNQKQPVLGLDEVEREQILKVLNHTNWHITRAAQILGISRPTIRLKIKKYEIVKQ
jgi:propionate catabolism operon transcriptional regulator